MTCVPASPVHIRNAPPGRSPRALRGGAPRLVYVVARRPRRDPARGNSASAWLIVLMFTKKRPSLAFAKKPIAPAMRAGRPGVPPVLPPR